jgi:hypothetical protein
VNLRGAALCAAALLAGCAPHGSARRSPTKAGSEGRDEPGIRAAARAAPARPSGIAPPRGSPGAAPARSSCEAEIERVRRAPSLPGATDLEQRRAEIFARAKADGVVFVRAPVARAASVEGERLRRSIFGAEDSVKALYEAYPTLARRRDLAREALLTDGYLYAAWPAFASALSALVRPEDLFQEPRIWIQRGGVVLAAELRRGASGAGYFYVDGPEPAGRVKLLLFDRVASDPSALAAPLHRDVAALSRTLGFEEMRLEHLGEDAIVAELRYGDVWVPSVLRAEGARLTLGCEVLPEGRAGDVARARDETRRREAVVDRLRAVMRTQVEEALPFDEPKTEVGQQDGKLRQNWLWAYRYGRTEFDFNEDRYRVFDGKGRPRVPQVCIDFVTDTFERASGSWFRGRGEPRERVPGRLDFAALGIDNERSVERFVEFAKGHPEALEVEELPDEERVPFARRAAFFAHLAAHRERYRPGDVVTIYGLRDDGKMHYHSFFVYDSDPVTGAPSLVAANAGRPRIRPWEAEMLSAPLRSIRTRIRPRLEWLESVVAPVDPPAPHGAGASPARATSI